MAGLNHLAHASPAAAAIRPAVYPLVPRAWLAALVGAAVGSVLFAVWVTGGGTATQAVADAGAELTHILRFMALLKCVFGAGVLWLVSLRLRFQVAPRLAAGYIGGGMVMASGPGVIWNVAHVGLGAALFYLGVAILFILTRLDEATNRRFGKSGVQVGHRSIAHAGSRLRI